MVMSTKRAAKPSKIKMKFAYDRAQYLASPKKLYDQ